MTTEPEPRVSHTAELVERHRITIPVGATGDNVAVARLHAEAYARDRGFDIKPGSFQVIAATRTGMPIVADGGYLGVAFDVVVGKGDEPGDWTFSGGAAKHWYDRLARVAPGPIAPVVGVVDPDGSRRIRPRERGGVTGQLPDGTHVRLREVPEEPTPRVDRGELHWGGPDALAGPAPGDGPAVGTGPLPPWLRRGTDEDPDL